MLGESVQPQSVRRLLRDAQLWQTHADEYEDVLRQQQLELEVMEQSSGMELGDNDPATLAARRSIAFFDRAISWLNSESETNTSYALDLFVSHNVCFTAYLLEASMQAVLQGNAKPVTYFVQ